MSMGATQHWRVAMYELTGKYDLMLLFELVLITSRHLLQCLAVFKNDMNLQRILSII